LRQFVEVRDIGAGGLADSIPRSHVALRMRHAAVRSSLNIKRTLASETRGSNASSIELGD
jgi:hypothetical protein